MLFYLVEAYTSHSRRVKKSQRSISLEQDYHLSQKSFTRLKGRFNWLVHHSSGALISQLHLCYVFWDYLDESLDVLSCLSPWKKSRIPRIQIIPFLTVFPLRLCGLWGNPSTFSTIALPISLLYYSLYHWLNSKESFCSVGDTGDTGLIPGSGRSPGGGNGNPLKYSCLENNMNRGAWQAAVHGVPKSWTWLRVHAYAFTDNIRNTPKCENCFVYWLGKSLLLLMFLLDYNN